MENKFEAGDAAQDVNMDDKIENAVDSEKAYSWGEKLRLVVISLCISRMPYEALKAFQKGITTTTEQAVELAYAILQNLPLALINLHILLMNAEYLPALTNTAGYEEYVRLSNSSLTEQDILAKVDHDQTEAMIVALSDAFAVYSIAKVTASLFEFRGINIYCRRKHIDNTIYEQLCSFAAFGYHLFHFVGRLLTLVVGSIVFYPAFAAALFFVLVLSRAAVHHFTRSERSWLFAIVTVFVGTNAWDTLFAARVVHLMEIVEGGIVAGLIYVDVANIPYPVLSVQNILVLKTNVQSLDLLAALILADLAVATILHLLVIERFREYDPEGVLGRWRAEAQQSPWLSPFVGDDDGDKRRESVAPHESPV